MSQLDSLRQRIVVARHVETETVERLLGGDSDRCVECRVHLPVDRVEGHQRWIEDVTVGEEVTLELWDAEDLATEPQVETLRCCSLCAGDLRAHALFVRPPSEAALVAAQCDLGAITIGRAA